MQKVALCAGGAGLLLTCAAAEALVVADYQDDFQGPQPAAGWAYLWNANGPVGDPAHYVPLSYDAANGRYETEANGAYPDAAPGSYTAAGPDLLHPGQGSQQNAIERFVLAAYTVSADDIAAAGGNQATVTGGFFSVGDSDDGLHAIVYVNGTVIVPTTILPPEQTFPELSLPLGTVNAGDTIYVSIGSRGNDSGDTLTLDFSIELSAGSAPALVNGLSRRSHGAAGEHMLVLPLSGVPAVEPRRNSAGDQIILMFTQEIEAVDGSIDCGQEIVIDQGTCFGAFVFSNSVIVSATAGENVCVTVTVSGLRAAGGGDALIGDADLTFVSHAGDINSDSSVNLLDLQVIKNGLFGAVSASSFLLDVNGDGVINLLDLQTVKNNLFQPAACP
jgi:hypothetical protein